MQVERDVAHHRGGAQGANGQHGLAARVGMSGGGRIDRPEIAADHQAHELRLVQAGGWPRSSDRAPFPHHRNFVGDREHFFQTVRDEYDRALRAFEPRDHVKEALDFAWAQRRRRLIENDEIGLQCECFRDLDQLALCCRKIPCLRIERNGVLLTEIGEDLARPPAHGGARQPTGPAEIREENVFQDRQVRRKAGLLHDHGDARIERLARAPDVERFAAIEDLAPVATDVAGNHAGKGRLSRAIGAQERMGRAWPQGETCADERARLREALRDRARFQKRSCRVCHRLARERGQR